jgi:adenylate kinase
MKDLFFITGVAGCGKSTIAEYLSESARHNSSPLDYGDVLLELAPNVSHRDDLLGVLDSRAIYDCDRLAVRRILSMRESSHVFLEFHTSALTEQGFVSFGFEELRSLRPTGILLIESPPRDIIAWRARDNASAGRRRRVESCEDIERHQEVCRMITCVYSVIAGVPFKIILNESGKLESTLSRSKEWVMRFGCS